MGLRGRSGGGGVWGKGEECGRVLVLVVVLGRGEGGDVRAGVCVWIWVWVLAGGRA